ncbi:MAG TPA: VWA domain-containing protein [Thermoanaerobaculia bacterium]
MKSSVSLCSLLMVALLGLWTLPARAEQRFSQSTDVVVVEVPVQVLRDGKPVRGLTAGDFEVYEGRSRQPVTGFETLDLTTAPTTPEAARRVPMSARRRFVLMFDLGFSSPAQMARAREAAKSLLHGSFHPTDLVAIAAYIPAVGPKLLLGFTPDHKLVESAIDHLSPVQMFSHGYRLAADPLELAEIAASLADGDSAGYKGKRGDSDKNADANFSAGSGFTDHLNPVSSVERSDREAQAREITQFTKALGVFADTMASVHGRKYVLLLSPGFESSILTGTSDDDKVWDLGTHSVRGDVWNIDSDELYGSTKVGSQLEKMLEALRRADCVVESVDIGGIRASADDLHAARNPGADGLFTIADSTGGEYIGNFNNLAQAMEKVLDNTSVTYVLSFQPDVKRDGQYHKIRVELKDPKGARVVYRRGYYAPKPFAQETQTARMLDAATQVVSGQEGGPVGLSVLTAPFKMPGEKAYVPVLIEIDGPSLTAGNPGNALPAEVYAYAMDEKGTVADYFGRTLALDLAKVGPVVSKTGIKLFADFDLPPGSYSVRVLVRNGQTGATGLRVASLEVPAFAQGSPVLLPAFFPEPPNRWLMIRQTKTRKEEIPYPFMARDRPYVPASKPLLTPGAEAVMALTGYHLGAGPLAAQAMIMTADGKEIGAGKVKVLGHEAAAGDGPERLTTTFQPPALPPGDYELLVTVSDPQGKSETSVTPFAVPAASEVKTAARGAGR